jgi:hypothetical protein
MGFLRNKPRRNPPVPLARPTADARGSQSVLSPLQTNILQQVVGELVEIDPMLGAGV